MHFIQGLFVMPDVILEPHNSKHPWPDTSKSESTMSIPVAKMSRREFEKGLKKKSVKEYKKKFNILTEKLWQPLKVGRETFITNVLFVCFPNVLANTGDRNIMSKSNNFLKICWC